MMCLNVVYQGKRKKEALAKLPESKYYWKVVTLRYTKYWPPIYDSLAYKTGWNTTKFMRPSISGENYTIAYHLFYSKESAIKWKSGFATSIKRTLKIVRCRVEKRDIIHIGMQRGRKLCVVTTRFWMPKPKKKPA